MLKKKSSRTLYEEWLKTQIQHHDFKHFSVISCLVADLKEVVVHKAERKITNESLMDEKNARQVELLSKKNTIWHAVSAYGTDEGKESWSFVLKKDTDWKDERGQFGETPLHIALLINEPSEEFNEFFIGLWGVASKSVRGAIYTMEPYTGENVLHLAIIKKFGLDIIEKLVNDEPYLVNGKAVGAFFRDKDLSESSCDQLGEYPICFAACTNQKEVFKYLADVEIEGYKGLEVVTSNGNNLLHLMIFNAFDESGSRSGSAEDSVDPSEVQTSGENSENAEDIFMDMFDSILKLAEAKEKTKPAPKGAPSLKQRMLSHRNEDGQTPLALAAAYGTVAFFKHLLKQTEIVAWTYGPVTCMKVYLEGIDYPLDAERHPGLGASLLETLVAYGRQDIVSRTEIKKLVQLKWDKYGQAKFRNRLIKSLLFAALVFVMPMLECSNTLASTALHSAIRVAASLFYLLDYCAVCKTTLTETAALLSETFALLKRILYDDFLVSLYRFCTQTDTPGVDEGQRKQLYNEAHALLRRCATFDYSWTRLYHATVPPCMVVLSLRYIASTWFATLVGIDLADAPLSSLPSAAVHCGYAFVSAMTFANVLYLSTCFERVGACVLMLRRITLNDLPVFAAVYAIFLFGCAAPPRRPRRPRTRALCLSAARPSVGRGRARGGGAEWRTCTSS